MHRFWLVIFILLCATGMASGPAAADDRSTCTSPRWSIPGDDHIRACGRLIATGKFKGEELGEIFKGRGLGYDKKRDYSRALADYNEAIRLHPNYAGPYIHRGVIYRKKGDHARALADLNEALRISDFDDYALAQRAVVYEQLGRWQEAFADYKKAADFAVEDQQRYNDSARRIEQRLAAAGLNATLPAAPAPAASASATHPTITPVSFERQPSLEPSAAAAASGPRVALVIGNGEYRHASRLLNPGNDATDIAESLRKLGFDVVEGRDLDKRGMEDRVREFGRKLDRASIALFFYAGHGMQVGGKNYLLPVDSKLERPGDLNFETIDISFILAQMEAEQRVNLVFLDACRDNPLSRSFSRSLGTRSTSVGQGLATIQSAIGTMIGYATRPDAVALDGDGRNSPFTAALLKHLSTPGVDIGALMRRVRVDVVAATRGKQVPWDHSSLMGDVILAR